MPFCSWTPQHCLILPSWFSNEDVTFGDNHRPQGNIFTSVCHSVHGGGLVSQHASQVIWPGGLHPGAPASGGSLHLEGVCIQGICIQGGLGRSPIEYYRIRSTSERTASYWNAFLLLVISTNAKNQFHFFFFFRFIIQTSSPAAGDPEVVTLSGRAVGGGWKQRRRTSGWTGWSTRWSARPWRRRGAEARQQFHEQERSVTMFRSLDHGWHDPGSQRNFWISLLDNNPRLLPLP